MKSCGQVQEKHIIIWRQKVGLSNNNNATKIIDQVKGSNKSFNQLTIDTVKGFYKDAQDSYFKI